MSRTSLTTAAALALTLALSAATVAIAQDGEPADPVTSATTGEASDRLIPQDGALATYEEHIRALNDCDWLGLVAQYPNNAELHFVNGSVTVGREAIGAVFDGFVKSREEGGLCGLTFTEQTRLEVGDTEVVFWEADADFLAEPYYGSDAYVTDGQYMVAMVSTFDGSKLVFADAAMAEDEMAEEMSEAEEEVADEKEEAQDEVDEAKQEVEEEKEEAKEQAG
jgi:hypothetical protein